ncbi:MAG: hypothetical protein Q8Q47_03600, partial [Ignavibacteriaceae bacterium]|nr:hypothetical protein [Ignavibacteriaceae bacterium]
KLHLHEHDFVFIGDNLNVLEVAVSIGAYFFFIANGNQSKEALSKSNVIVVDQISDLIII